MPTETLIKPLEVVTDGIFRPAPTTTNFDANLIAPFIASAEEGNTIRILGKDLYEAMIAAQNPNVSNYNPDAGALVQKFPTNAFYETLWTKYLLRYEGLICYATALRSDEHTSELQSHSDLVCRHLLEKKKTTR